MLIITRRNGESLFITRDIEVRVLGVKGNQVRIGIVAPRDLPVYREEIADTFGGEATLAQVVAGMVDPVPAGAG